MPIYSNKSVLKLFENNDILQFDWTDCFQISATHVLPPCENLSNAYMFFYPQIKTKINFLGVDMEGSKKIRLQKPRIGASNNMNCPNRTSKKSSIVSQK